MTARTWMVWGTSSDAGKSTVAAALCRLFAREGLRVAPFKAQNMARNAYVCADGGEIGVAQAVQALAARVAPCTDHNPILLKPEPGMVAQVVLDGRAVGKHTFGEYGAMNERMRASVAAALARLRATNDVVVMEGAGSPAEINLAARDLANLESARLGDADILLVADIDRGGVFASIVGTLALVPDDLRPRVRGVVINKLRGDPSLLTSGIADLEARIGVRVLGVVPHAGELRLPDEDSLGIERYRTTPRAALEAFEVTVVDTPALANFEDVVPLTREPGVTVRASAEARDLLETDLLVLAGSKSTVHDLEFLRARGLDAAIRARVERGRPILAICGGTQMLGRTIRDPESVESEHVEVDGLDLLPLVTTYGAEKRTERVEGALQLGDASASVRGFHLHHGRVSAEAGATPLVRLSDGTLEGLRHGAILATMIHRLLDETDARRAVLAWAGHVARGTAPTEDSEDPLDMLADHVRAHVDWPFLLSHALGREP